MLYKSSEYMLLKSSFITLSNRKKTCRLHLYKSSTVFNKKKLILLLFVVNIKLAINYKLMIALSEKTYIIFSLKHRFRRLKVQIKELKDEHD